MTRAKLFLAFFPLFFFGKNLFSQNFFQKTYDRDFRDECHALETLPNGDILMAGVTGLANSEFMWIQRLNQQGEVLWSQGYVGSASDDAVDIERAQIGTGFWIAYNSNGVGSWMKISETGDVLHSEMLALQSTFQRMLPLGDGGFLLSGWSGPANASNALAVKINANGGLVWATDFGSAGEDVIENCWEDGEGFIYCSGFSTNFDGDRDGLLAKLSPGGAVLWARRYGSASADAFSSIAPFGGDSSMLLAGYSTGFGGYKQAWLVKVNREGDLKWSRTYRLPDLELGAIDLLAIPGDQFVVSASDPDYQVGSPAILFKISADGDLLWEYQYRSGAEREMLREVLPTTGGFAAAGSATLNGNENFYLLKIAGDGLVPGSDCCPTQAGLLVQNVFPETEIFTPGASSSSNSVGQLVLVTEVEPMVTNVCTPFEVTFALSDSTICPNECVEIIVTENTPGCTYYFSTPGGQPDPDNPLRICYPSEGTYFISRTGQNGVCSKEHSIKIQVGASDDAFPNAFTPNGDGVNDTYKPLFFCPVVTTNFMIYNRWGQKVFETQDPNEAWDGKADGKEAPSDVYAWYVEYEAVREGQQQKFMEKGDVALLR